MDWRFSEFPNCGAHALYVTCVELMSVPEQPAVIGEKAKPTTDNRYLVFFDDGFASYLDHADLRVVVKASTDVWLDVDRESREFMKEYIQSFPLRRMIRLEVIIR